MFSDIDLRLKKRNKVLFGRNSECLQKLRRLISEQKNLTLVLWTFECLQYPLNELMLKYPDKTEIKLTYELCNKWAQGTGKMATIKKAIKQCRTLAKELEQDTDLTILHTGDFRDHGYRGWKLLSMIRKHITQYGNQKIDVLITEDTMMNRQEDKVMTEMAMQQWATKFFRENKYIFLLCSSTNLDSLWSFYNYLNFYYKGVSAAKIEIKRKEIKCYHFHEILLRKLKF